MAKNYLGQLEIQGAVITERAVNPSDAMRLEHVQELLAAKATSNHAHANDHPALSVSNSNSIALTLSNAQALEADLIISLGLYADANGVSVSFGTGANDVARGNHTHGNDHAALTKSDTNSVAVTLNAQAFSAQVKLHTDGALAEAADGLYVVLGTSATSAAYGNHTHANATSNSSGLMTGADKVKLDELVQGESYTFTSTNSVQLTTVNGEVTATVLVAEGLSVTANGVGVDFNSVAAESHVHDNASAVTAGFMSGADKAKLDAIPNTIHNALTVSNSNSVTFSVSNSQQLTGGIRLKASSGLVVDSNGVYVDFGSGATQVSAGNHAHANDHVALTKSDTNSIAVTLNGQAFSAAVRLKSSGSLLEHADGLYVDVGSNSGQVASGTHTHADATANTAGFMSATDKIKLDATPSSVENPLTFTSGNTITFARNSDIITAEVELGAGLTDANGVAVDFTQVAANTHIHSNVSNAAPGFMTPAQKAALESTITLTAGDARYVQLSAANQSIQQDIRIVSMKVGATGNAAISESGGLVRLSDVLIPGNLYLAGLNGVPGILTVTANGLVTLAFVGSSARFKDGNLQVWNNTITKFQSVWLDGPESAPAWQFGAGED